MSQAFLRRLRLGLLTVLGISLLLTDAASARRRSLPYFQFRRSEGQVAVQVRNDFSRRETTGLATVERSEWIIRQEVSLGGFGWIYHPALLQVSGKLGLEFEQDIQTAKGSETSVVDLERVNFDTALNFLPNKPYPITITAGNARSEIDSQFTQRRIVDSFHVGAGVTLRDLELREWKIPTRMLYRHLETDTNGTFATSRSRDEIRFISKNKTDNSRSRLQYEWGRQEATSGTNHRVFDRHDVRADHDYYLKRGGTVSSRLFYALDDSNDRTIHSASLNETLNLIHSDSLRSNYAYALNFQDTGANRQVSNSLSFGGSHQLYESLTSAITLGGSYSNSEFGSILRTNTGLGFDYTKKIPWGRMGLRFAPSFTYQDENVTPGLITIIDESYSVTFLQPEIELDNRCVVESTITLTDAARVPLVPAQFTLLARQEECDKTRIRIDDPAITAVLVSYEYQLLPARAFTTTVLSTGFNLALWEHLYFDFSYSDTDQTLLSGFASDTSLDDGTLLLTHLDLVFEHHRTRVQFEQLRSRISPRDRFTVSHRISYRPRRRLVVSATAAYAYDLLTDSGRSSNIVTAAANGTAWLPYGILLRLNLFGRYLDQQEQTAVAVGSFLSLTYRFGRLEFQLEDRFTWDTTSAKTFNQDTDEFENDISIRISRRF